MGDGRQIDRALRWHSGTNVFIHVLLFLGFFVETIGFCAMAGGGRRWLWLAVLGGEFLP